MIVYPELAVILFLLFFFLLPICFHLRLLSLTSLDNLNSFFSKRSLTIKKQHIKEKLKERYSKIALTGSSDCCCVPGECCDDSNNSHHSIVESTKLIGYDSKD
jgi:hypothetical protein